MSLPWWRRLYWRMYNAVDYPIRQKLRWRRGPARPANAPHDGLYAHLPEPQRSGAEARAIQLLSQYQLESFAADSSPANFRENLYYLDLLASAFEQAGVHLPDQLQAADIGPSHWFYVQALYHLYRWWQSPHGRSVRLHGFEADAYRVYPDLHSRFDHAQAHMRGLPGVEYLPQEFVAQPGAYHCITMLFPFVFETDHLQWGLPGQMFQPGALCRAAWASLQPNGVLVIVNQGAEEHAAQRQIFVELGITIRHAGRWDSDLFSYPHERYVLVAVNEP